MRVNNNLDCILYTRYFDSRCYCQLGGVSRDTSLQDFLDRCYESELREVQVFNAEWQKRVTDRHDCVEYRGVTLRSGLDEGNMLLPVRLISMIHPYMPTEDHRILNAKIEGFNNMVPVFFYLEGLTDPIRGKLRCSEDLRQLGLYARLDHLRRRVNLHQFISLMDPYHAKLGALLAREGEKQREHHLVLIKKDIIDGYGFQE